MGEEFNRIEMLISELRDDLNDEVTNFAEQLRALSNKLDALKFVIDRRMLCQK